MEKEKKEKRKKKRKKEKKKKEKEKEKEKKKKEKKKRKKKKKIFSNYYNRNFLRVHPPLCHLHKKVHSKPAMNLLDFYVMDFFLDLDLLDLPLLLDLHLLSDHPHWDLHILLGLLKDLWYLHILPHKDLLTLHPGVPV